MKRPMHRSEQRRGQRLRNRKRAKDPWLNRWVRRSDLTGHRVLVCDSEMSQVVAEYEPARTMLAKAGKGAGECWLWCHHCGRFFQAKDLMLDVFGNWEQCPFFGCGASGFDVDILSWQCRRHEGHWPQSIEQLSYGLRRL